MRSLNELRLLDWPEMTGEELEWLRKSRTPLHCQTMQRRSRVNRDETVFSDVEALSREVMDRKVAELEALGWRKSGTYFVRNMSKGSASGPSQGE